MSEIDCLAWFLVEWFHLLSAFGAKDGGHVVFVHDRFTRQVDEEKTVFVAVAGIAVAVKTIITFAFLQIRWQLFHGLAAPRAEDGGQVVTVHHRFLGQFENEWSFVRMGANLTVAVKFCRHDQHSFYRSLKTVQIDGFAFNKQIITLPAFFSGGQRSWEHTWLFYGLIVSFKLDNLCYFQTLNNATDMVRCQKGCPTNKMPNHLYLRSG